MVTMITTWHAGRGARYVLPNRGFGVSSREVHTRPFLRIACFLHVYVAD